jgi:hypothetical protein
MLHKSRRGEDNVFRLLRHRRMASLSGDDDVEEGRPAIMGPLRKPNHWGWPLGVVWRP